jgi:hypothetical protein
MARRTLIGNLWSWFFVDGVDERLGIEENTH